MILRYVFEIVLFKILILASNYASRKLSLIILK